MKMRDSGNTHSAQTRAVMGGNLTLNCRTALKYMSEGGVQDLSKVREVGRGTRGAVVN